jgi:hypothetical protein
MRELLASVKKGLAGGAAAMVVSAPQLFEDGVSGSDLAVLAGAFVTGFILVYVAPANVPQNK